MKTNLFFLLSLFVTNIKAQDYYEDQIFIQVKQTKDLEKTQYLEIKEKYRFLKVERAFRTSVLGEVYIIQFNPSTNLTSQNLIEDLEKLDFVIYAEQVPIYKLFFTPNDPQYSSQWNLAKIQADLAWNLSQGCSGIKVAITDD